MFLKSIKWTKFGTSCDGKSTDGQLQENKRQLATKKERTRRGPSGLSSGKTTQNVIFGIMLFDIFKKYFFI